MCRLRWCVAPSLTAVLKIAREHVEAMIAHAREDHPDEACGVVVGPEGSDVATRLVRMINADRSPTFFRFDPQEQFDQAGCGGGGDRRRLPLAHLDRGLSIPDRHRSRF
jgi:hypothetical protein